MSYQVIVIVKKRCDAASSIIYKNCKEVLINISQVGEIDIDVLQGNVSSWLSAFYCQLSASIIIWVSDLGFRFLALGSWLSALGFLYSAFGFRLLGFRCHRRDIKFCHEIVRHWGVCSRTSMR